MSHIWKPMRRMLMAVLGPKSLEYGNREMKHSHCLVSNAAAVAVVVAAAAVQGFSVIVVVSR